ncbi:glycoside hydrolase family 15 protein [Leifsonia sp. F6_8S_P_1B]|uniref:Glycoside hydrolase family 15 protein n=1 Tax=Leifsonia williamsii TaxID=3035919 RepID=A0ABT8K9W2_9MICO|nr:glycoside hydrolase family 15 protein [Leifsonia williamsii]MDN4614244.1 glycoside hydrolase family 15 protein [Leifsonia williamsii]
MTQRRIEDYALIGDLHTAAMVSVNGSVDWLCLPHFDSAACFAAMLDQDRAGRWRIAPRGADRCTRRRYRGDTLILETEWETPDGGVRVTDFMPVRDRAADLVRTVEGLSGSVEMELDLLLRFDYGHVVPWVTSVERGIRAIAGPDAVLVTSDVPLTGRDLRTVADFTVSAGERVSFVLTWFPSHLPAPEPADPQEALAATELYWTRWSAQGRAYGPYRDAIQRSLITLKALTYEPTGGIVAAPTTSLPEQPDGPRNWDYRFCWLRDATLALQSLLTAGYEDEARAWRDWLLRAVAGDPPDLRIMYGIDGRRRLPEESLDWLTGFDGSTPVRIGNAAAEQLQLDVWGEVLDGLALTRTTIGAGDDAWSVQQVLIDHLSRIWQEKDSGLWEVRGPTRHFTHSKLMSWVAADRMVEGARRFGLPGPVRRWERLRAQIRRDILANGYDADRNTFVQSYGSKELDAALLLIPRVGFLPGDDPRVIGTIDAIQRELTVDGFVLRYRPEASDDGLPGQEGVFLACSFWMVDALIGAGRRDEAEELFLRLLALRNDVGLLSEEWDVRGERQLGNAPQAFSHFALVRSAFQLLSGGTATTEGRIPIETAEGARS